MGLEKKERDWRKKLLGCDPYVSRTSKEKGREWDMGDFLNVGA